ncbi:MAG: peptide ABC transporter substrate-binding protein [Candidatus Entotheonella factor]|uniref:Glutathione import ATP-binding protein GsiA n=1 Tax=Entotheonella factor TaxID=1429438 RepID=W4LQP3_ENTF1|nr:MAG: peptide ABC transporter substrate-binding protein [Candidatus Entotheonella factor]
MLLDVSHLRKYFQLSTGLLSRRKSSVQAVDEVSFQVDRGETLGIVGESGCGKSTLARLIIRLIDPDAGEVRLDGQTVGAEVAIRDMRRAIQMVFQDSYSSLNPRLSIEESVAFAPAVHGDSHAAAARRAHQVLAQVGLDPAQFAHRYPHELSGGQRQRVNIARALALLPQIVILDEAVSALDKSVEAQVLNLLMELKREFHLTYLFISHDLNVVNYMSDRVLVMYLGKVVEIGPAEGIAEGGVHPYTRALYSAMPSMDPDQRVTEPPLTGDPPNPINPPSGCRFHPRCPFAEPVCTDTEPQLYDLSIAPGYQVACHMTIPGSGHTGAGVATRSIAEPNS